MILMQVDNDADKTSYLLIVIEADNLERMKNADPITLRPKTEGGFIEPIKYPDKFGLLLAFEGEADVGKLYELQKDPAALLRHLLRGFKYNKLDGIKVTPGEEHGKA